LSDTLQNSPVAINGSPRVAEGDYGLDAKTAAALNAALGFTRAYRDNLDQHQAIREARCLAEQYPALFREMMDHHIFAGRRYYRPLAGFSAELNCNQEYKCLWDHPGYEYTDEDRRVREKLGISNSGFCHDHVLMTHIAGSLPDDSDLKQAVLDMQAFWLEHSMRRRYNELLTDEILRNMGRTTGFDSRYCSGFIRQDCFSLDYDKLLQLGIPGLRGLIKAGQADPESPDAQPELYEGMLGALDVLVSVIDYYIAQFHEAREATTDDARRAELAEMIATLKAIRQAKPATLREAIQLFWLYNLMADSPNYGRMDVYLGDFYCRDVDDGVVTKDEAHRLLCGLWTLISEVKGEGGPTQPNSRLVVGGRGRRNEANANRFALAAMDVVEDLRVREPNVTLRFYKGQDPALFRRALDLIGEGCIHPGLYNDDEHIPMVRDWYHVGEADAEHYLPEGCGEILIDHRGFGSPNNILLYPSALDLVLHNGFDTVTGEQRGLPLGSASDFGSFDKLLDAFTRQLKFTFGILAKRHAIEHQVEREMASFLMMSILSDDCIARGRGLFDGGVRYLGGIIETFGLTTAANSLIAIKKLVFDQQVMTLEKLIEITDANFEGYAKEHRMMLDCPKFGNDVAEVDDLHTELSRVFNEYANEAGKAAGLDFFLNCNLNPGGLYYSEYVKATPDGRLAGVGMPLGNAPTPGTDIQGITALLNSMAKHAKGHGGYVHNVKVSRDLFTPENRPKIEAVFRTFFDNGGEQLMVTALNSGDLEAALADPENHKHILVRVAGWTAQFVELPQKYQQQILSRTFYC